MAFLLNLNFSYWIFFDAELIYSPNHDAVW